MREFVQVSWPAIMNVRISSRSWPIRHRLAGRVVPDAHQLGQDVGAALGPSGVMLPHQALHGLVEGMEDALELAVAPRGDLAEQAGVGRRQPAEHPEARRQGPRGLAGLVVLDVRVEDHLRQRRHRQPDHLVRNVHDLAVPPSVGDSSGALDQQADVLRHPAVMEHGLDEPALPVVDLPLARQEPVAEQALRLLEDRALLEARMVGDEDVLHVVRVADQEHPEPAHVERRDVAVLLREARHEAERVGPEGPERLVGRRERVRRRRSRAHTPSRRSSAERRHHATSRSWVTSCMATDRNESISPGTRSTSYRSAGGLRRSSAKRSSAHR